MKNRTKDQVYDEWLVIRCQGGDRAALTGLINRWSPRLRRYVRRLTDGHDDTEDLVQEIWASVVKKLSRLRDPACFPQWIYRIATTRCADWTRQKTRQRKLKKTAGEESAVTVEPESTGAENKRMQLLREAIGRLPAEQRALVSLFYVDEMSVREISEALGLPEGTVKSRLFHLRESLKQTIERKERWKK